MFKQLRFAALTLVCSMLIQAANDRSWVSNTGSDNNPCTLAAPCSTPQHAHDLTNPGGEVDVLNSGDYGVLIITKAITIDGGGANSTILVDSNGSGISINGFVGRVTLRNLSISNRGFGRGGTGIRLADSGAEVDRISISGLDIGINISLSPSAQGSTSTLMKDVTITGCIGACVVMNGALVAELEHAAIDNGVFGCSAQGGARVSIRHSTVTNTDIGVRGVDNASEITVEDSHIGNARSAGVAAGNGATIRLSNSIVVNNVTGLGTFSGGQILSFGNNRITGNSTDGDPTGWVIMR